MVRKIRRCGGSLQVALTPYAIEELGLKEGDKVDVRIKNKEVTITKVKEGK